MKLELVKAGNNTSISNNLRNFADYENNTIYYPLYEASIEKLETKYSAIPELLYKGRNAEAICTEHDDRVILKEYIEAHNRHCGASKDYICICQEKADLYEETSLILIYGMYTGRKISIIPSISYIEELISSSTVESVMVFSQIEHMELNSFINLLNNSRGVMMGYIPYEDKYKLNFFIAKLLINVNKEAGHKHMMINRVSLPEEGYLEELNKDYEFRYYPKPCCTMDKLLEEMLYKGPILELNYLSHCRECILFLNDFYLCGRTGKGEEQRGDTFKHTPCCFYDEESCIAKNRKRYEAALLNADILFLNGCKLGDMNKSIIPYKYTIVSNLIDNNAVSIIASPTIKVGQLAENLLAHNMLKYGYSEGEKLIYINSFLEYSQIEAPMYFLIGDPRLKAKPDCCCKSPEIIHTKNVEAESHIFEVTGIKGETMVEVDLEHISSAEAAYIVNMTVQPKLDDITAQSIFFFLTNGSHGEPRKLMIFAKQSLECEKITVEIACKDKTKQKVQEIRESIDNILFYKNNFVLDNTIKGRIQDLQHNFKTVYPLLKEYSYKYYSLTKLSAILEKTERRIERIFEDIFEAIVEYTASKLDNYHEKISEKRFAAEEKLQQSFCISCKGKERSYPYSLLTFEKDYRRVNYKCMSCGMIRDIPDDKLHIESIGVPSFTSEGTMCETVKITNKHKDSISIDIACICTHTKDIEITPQKQRESLMPGESCEFSFTLKPKEGLKKHYYVFAFYIMAKGKFYYHTKIISHV